jgi:hypothetical protein
VYRFTVPLVYRFTVDKSWIREIAALSWCTISPWITLGIHNSTEFE